MDERHQINMVKDIVEENGKTVFENNMERQHDVPIGTLVRLTFDPYKGVCLFVFDYGRDCDGSPLYALSAEPGLEIPPMPRAKDFEDEREFWRKRELWAFKAGASWGLVSDGGFEAVYVSDQTEEE